MSTLPELTNEQVDEAYRITYGIPHDEPVVRNIHWRVLRGAFPAPKPPKPTWTAATEQTRVLIHTREHGVVVKVGSSVDTLPASVARDMAAALIEAADWIEANR